MVVRCFVAVKMLIRRLHQPHEISITPSSHTVSIRSFVAAALLWSTTYESIEHQVAVAAMNASDNPSRSKNRTTIASTSTDTSSALSDLLTAHGVTSTENKNLSSNLIWHHITEPIGSTQDEIRKLLHQHKISNDKAIAVLADIQLEGRGTQGRRWEMGDIDSFQQGDDRKDNNLYMTVAIPFDKIPITITLLPLQIGVFVADRVSNLIQLCQRRSVQVDPANDKRQDYDQMNIKMPKVTVKWPNDVLVDQRKISGTLIETEFVSYDDDTSTMGSVSWMLIGIGINVAAAPRNLSSRNRPGKHIRPPCCIQDFCDPSSFNEIDGFRTATLPSNTAEGLGQDLASAIADWVLSESTLNKRDREDLLIQQWRSYAEWGVQYELRGRVVDTEHGGFEGERVTTLDIEHDGQLRVRGADGRERLLVADYLF